MTFVRAIRDDLVEKRLWPLAVVLLVALAAIPFVLGRSGADAPAAPLPDPSLAAPPVSEPSARTASLREDVAERAPTGPAKDPFRGAAAAAGQGTETPVNVATPVVPDEPAGAPAPAPAPATGDTGSSVSGAAATQVPAPSRTEEARTETAPAAAPARHAAGYRVDLDWGPAADPRALRDVARLTALDAGGDPAIVFMGVRPDGRTALFLLLGEAPGSGDARCRPTEDMCRLLEMRAGDTQFLDVMTDGGVRQYELHVDRVSERTAVTEQDAKERLDRASKPGGRLVKDTIASGRTFVRRYVYAEKLGVVKFVAAADEKAATRGVLEPAE